MLNFISIVSIIVVFISTFLLITILAKPKKSALAQFVEKSSNSKQEQHFKVKKFLLEYNAQNIINEARKYEWELTKQKYWLYVVIAGGTIAIFGYYVFGKEPITLITFLLGFYFPRIKLHQMKKKYRFIVIERLSTYMKTVANALRITNNTVKVLYDIKPMMHESIQEEIEKAALLLESGASLESAFKSFNKKYNFRELIFFHQMLAIANREGSADSTKTLIDIATDFEKQKLYMVKLNTKLTQTKRAYFQNTAIVILLPVFMMIMSDEAYKYLAQSTLGRVGMISVLAILLFVSTRVGKISNFNPSER